MPTAKTALKKVFTLAEAFVVEQKGHWGNAEREKAPADVQKAVVEIDNDGAKRSLRNILESGRDYVEFDEETRSRARNR